MSLNTSIILTLISANVIVQFTTFRQVHAIPSQFIEQHVRLRGSVKRVDHDATLYVEHIPIIRLSRKSFNNKGAQLISD